MAALRSHPYIPPNHPPRDERSRVNKDEKMKEMSKAKNEREGDGFIPFTHISKQKTHRTHLPFSEYGHETTIRPRYSANHDNDSISESESDSGSDSDLINHKSIDTFPPLLPPTTTTIKTITTPEMLAFITLCKTLLENPHLSTEARVWVANSLNFIYEFKGDEVAMRGFREFLVRVGVFGGDAGGVRAGLACGRAGEGNVGGGLIGGFLKREVVRLRVLEEDESGMGQGRHEGNEGGRRRRVRLMTEERGGSVSGFFGRVKGWAGGLFRRGVVG